MIDAHGTTASHAEPDTGPDHHADAHAAGHDEHHEADTLGPIDWRMWGAGVVGLAVAAIVVAATVIATDFTFLAVAPAA